MENATESTLAGDSGLDRLAQAGSGARTGAVGKILGKLGVP